MKSMTETIRIKIRGTYRELRREVDNHVEYRLYDDIWTRLIGESNFQVYRQVDSKLLINILL